MRFRGGDIELTTMGTTPSQTPSETSTQEQPYSFQQTLRRLQKAANEAGTSAKERLQQTLDNFRQYAAKKSSAPQNRQTLGERIRSRQYILAFLAAIIVIVIGLLVWMWNTSDASISHDSKIAFTVFDTLIGLGSLVVFLALWFGFFSFPYSNDGMRYPLPVRNLFLLIAIICVGLAIYVYSSNVISSNTTKTAISVTLVVLAVLSGGAGLYFSSTLIPVDYDQLKEYLERKSASAKFVTKTDFTDRRETVREAFLDAGVLSVEDVDNLLKNSYSEFLQEAPELLSKEQLDLVKDKFEDLKKIDPLALKSDEVALLADLLQEAKQPTGLISTYVRILKDENASAVQKQFAEQKLRDLLGTLA